MSQKHDHKLSLDKFHAPPTLQQLLARAEQHQACEQMILAALPPELSRQVRFLSYQDGELVLSAETATRASQIRFRQHEIMERLRQEEAFRYVWKLRVRVLPARSRKKPGPVRRSLSRENARLLAEEAGHTKDKALREVLERLARHAAD